MTENKAAQPQDKYVLRMPDGMRDRLKAAADKNNRSMNAEILYRLSTPLRFEDARNLLEGEDVEFQMIVSESSTDEAIQRIEEKLDRLLER